MNKIVWGTAIRWEPENRRLIVELDDHTFGFVHESELTLYPEFSVKNDDYSRAAAYCVGVRLKYAIIASTSEGCFLSRKRLAEDTLANLKSEKFHDYVVGIITGVEEKNIFLDIEGVYGICPAANMAYTYLNHCGTVFQRGETFKFAISCIKEDNKLLLSRTAALPSKDTLLKGYPPNTIITGRLLLPVNSKFDSENVKSWFFINTHESLAGIGDAKSIPGIVEIPTKARVKPGMDVGIVITKLSVKAGYALGLRGNLTVC